MSTEGIDNKSISTRERESCPKRRSRTPTFENFVNDCDVPDWLLIEILLRLPLKPIFTFKCVSKRWLSLISDPLFARTYASLWSTSSSPPWTVLFLYATGNPGQVPANQMGLHVAFKQYSEFTSPNFELGFLANEQQEDSPIRVLATSNGLLLCCATVDWQNDYYVCNPLTAQWVALPKPPRIHEWVSNGFITKNGNYKVVRLILKPCGFSDVLNLETFSSETGQWKESKVSCPERVRLCIFASRAVLYNEILLWSLPEHKIIAYDPNNNADQCRIMNLPRNRQGRAAGILGMCRGRLRYIESGFFIWDAPNLSVWVLTNYDAGEWYLELRTQMKDIWAHNPCLKDISALNPYFQRLSSFVRLLQPLAFHPLNMELVFLTYGVRMFLYNFRTHLLEVVYTEFHPKGLVYPSLIFPFVLPPWPTIVPQPTWEATL